MLVSPPMSTDVVVCCGAAESDGCDDATVGDMCGCKVITCDTFGTCAAAIDSELRLPPNQTCVADKVSSSLHKPDADVDSRSCSLCVRM